MFPLDAGEQPEGPAPGLRSAAPGLRVVVRPSDRAEARASSALESARQLCEHVRQMLAPYVRTDVVQMFQVDASGVTRLGEEAFPPEPWSEAAGRLRAELERGTASHEAQLARPALPGEALALHDGMRSAWYLPLSARGALVGVVAAYAARPAAFEHADVAAVAPLLGILASLVRERQQSSLEGQVRRAQIELAASEKLGALGRFAEGVAHEVNNPAAYVLTNLEHVRTLVETWADAPRELLHAIDEGVEGMRRIRSVLSDLGLLSRSTEEPVEAVDVNRVVDAVIGLISRQISARARVELDLEPLEPIASNRARLTQILLDLVLNAAQACSEEHQELNIIRIRTRTSAGRIEVSVSDTGSGIRDDQLSHLYEPFYTTKPTGQGSGLGLAVTRALVHGLGGRIRFDTRLGVGTTFVVELPDVRPVEARRRPSRPTPMAPPSRPRVLLVDDEAGIRKALKRALARRSDVITAASGEEAIQLLAGGAAFDLVISDLLLPGKNGIDIYACIEEKRPELLRRVLFLTGGATTPVARRFVAANPGAVLMKPIDTSRLDAIIHAVVRGTSVRSAIRLTRPGAGV